MTKKENKLSVQRLKGLQDKLDSKNPANPEILQNQGADNLHGYKKTKIGWIPEDWDCKKLKSICLQITDGKHGDCENQLLSGYFFISARDIKDGKIVYENARQIAKSDFEETHKRTRLEPGDILLSNSGSIGKTAIAQNNELTAKTTFQKSVAIIKPNKIRIDSYFLYFNLTYQQKYLERIATGSSQKNLLLGDINKILIPLPPFSEQKKIAKILSTWDEAIEKTRTLIAAREKLKKALMQQLLTGKKRFREFEGKEWKTKRIKEIGRVVAGGTPDTKNQKYWNGNIYWCIPTDITALKGKYITQTARKITKEVLKNSSAEILPPKSVIVCTRATIGECAINTVPMATNQGFKSIVPDTETESEYLYYWIKLNKNVLLRLGAGSTFFEVPKMDFEKIKIIIPSRAEQKKIVAVLSTFDKEIELLNKKLAALQRQKKGLMQVLLSGKVRVKV